jgi:hypothetical protein
MSFWISWDSSMPICPRQKVLFFFFVVIVVACALLCSSFAGLSPPPAPAFSLEWRELFFFLFLLRPGAAECYIWDSIFFLSYVQVSRATVAQRSGYYYFIARRQTELQMARSGCRETRGRHHLPAEFGFLRPPAWQLSCWQSSCP